jgi:hypothetical protein
MSPSKEVQMEANAAARLLAAKQIALFCGAGISLDPPAGLPDWHDLRDLTIAAVATRDPRPDLRRLHWPPHRG